MWARYVRDIKEHRATISTNQENYQRYLDRIKKQEQSNTQFKSWQDFTAVESLQFQKQIDTDLNYLLPGQSLFAQAIATIRGIVDIEQQQLLRDLDEKEAKRDRALQNTIAIVGVGLSSAAVGATVSPYLIKMEPDRPLTLQPFRFDPLALNPVHPVILALLFSGFCAIIGITIWAIVAQLIQNRPGSDSRTSGNRSPTNRCIREDRNEEDAKM